MNTNSLLQCINVMKSQFESICPITASEARTFFMAYDRAYELLIKSVIQKKLEEDERRTDELIRQVFGQLGNNVGIA